MPSCFSTFRQFYGIFHFSLSECSCVKFSVILSCFHFMRLHMPDRWFLVEYCVELFFSDLHSFPLRASKGRGGGGCMSSCSLQKIAISPLFPKNKFWCSPKFILPSSPVPWNYVPCSRNPEKYYEMFPTISSIFQFLMDNYVMIYLTIHSRDNLRQNASFFFVMNVVLHQTPQMKVFTESFEDSWILYLTMLGIAHFSFLPNPFCKRL